MITMWTLAVVNDAKTDSTGNAPPPPRTASASQELIRQVAAGDAAAFAALYDTHGRAVFSLAIRIVSDQAEAEEVVHDVFSQAWRQARRYDGARVSVAGWLLMMARSRAIDRVRARGARPDAASPPHEGASVRLPDPASGQDVAVQTGKEAVRLRTALADLPFLQRVAIELAYFDGLSQTQIADRLEQPLGTIKTRIRAGLWVLKMKLRAALEDINT